MGRLLPMNNVSKCRRRWSAPSRRWRGIQIFTNVNGRPLEARVRADLRAHACRDLLIKLHPTRGLSMPDYASEKKSKLEICGSSAGATSERMRAHGVLGLLRPLAELKVITHHGRHDPVPEDRIGWGMDCLGARTADEDFRY